MNTEQCNSNKLKHQNEAMIASKFLFALTLVQYSGAQRLITAGPAWMECEGEGFDPRWKELKNLLQDSRFAKFTSDDHDLPGGETIVFNRIIDEPIMLLTQELYNAYFQAALEFARHVESFDWGNLDGIEERRGESDWHSFMAAVGLEKSVPAQNEEWLCPLGFINAASIIARMLMTDPETIALASQQYHMIQSILGWNHEMNFLSSSNWPISNLEIMRSHEQVITSFRPPDIMNRYHQDFCSMWKSNQFFQPDGDHANGEFRIGAFGHHVPLMLEPVTMLLATLEEDVDVDVQFRGAYYACYVTPELCENLKNDPLTELLQFWTTKIDKNSDGQVFDEVVLQMRDLLLADENFMQSEFFICTAIFAPCLSLFITLATTKDNLNLLLYQSTELLLSIPETRKANVLLDMDKFMAYPGTNFVYNSCLWSGRTLYQTNHHIPVLPSVAWYVHLEETVQYKASNGVLVFRSPILEKTSHGNAFWTALEHFRGKRFRYYFDAMKCPPFSEQVGSCSAVGKLSYKQMASYTAVVMFPHDFTIMSFGDFYSMHVPIFLPEKQWTIRNLGAVFMKHGSLCKDTNGTSVIAVGIQEQFPFSAHWDQSDPADGHDVSLRKLSYWYEYSEFTRYPHVFTFKSIPDLLAQIHNDGAGIDTNWISTRMKWHHDRQISTAADAYGSMLTAIGRPISTSANDVERRESSLRRLRGFVNKTSSLCTKFACPVH